MSRVKHRIVEPLYISRHRNLNDSHTNSKSKALNPKQIHINQIQSPKRINVIFEHLNPAHLKIGWMNLGFRYCLGFGILRLGFSRAKARFFRR